MHVHAEAERNTNTAVEEINKNKRMNEKGIAGKRYFRQYPFAFL